jgi:hypothetical protein
MDEALRDRRDRMWGCSVPNRRASLAWDDVTFIETGPGRRRLSDDERAILGDRTAVFPLLA